MNNKVIVIENWQQIFQLQLSTFENCQLQLQPNCVINYNFVNYNYNFSKPGLHHWHFMSCSLLAETRMGMVPWCDDKARSEAITSSLYLQIWLTVSANSDT